MNLDMVVDYLNQYNEKELFYKEYHACSQNPADLKQFLDSLSMDELLKLDLVVPELCTENIPIRMYNEDYFDEGHTKNVSFVKHNRYTPPFEHTHTFFEVIYVLSGSCRHNIFHNTYILSEGDLCLLSPCVRHSVYVDDDSIILNILMQSATIEDIFYNILRSQNLISNFLLNSLYLDNFHSCLLFHTYQDEDIRRQILEMYMEYINGDEYSDRIIVSMLMIFFTYVLRKYKKTAECKNLHHDFSELLRYIIQEYDTITLASLAEKLNFSIPYCSKYIKKCTGSTFSQLLKKVRFQKATELLINSNLNIRSISDTLGYENPENFIRAFKKEYHLSPTQYRLNHKN